MSKPILVTTAILGCLFAQHAMSDVPIAWQTSGGNGNANVGIQLTPDGTGIIVFESPQVSSSNNATVAKLDSLTGSSVWSKTITVNGRVLVSGTEDNSGNLFLGSGWGGYRVYKYDSTLTTNTWTYTLR